MTMGRDVAIGALMALCVVIALYQLERPKPRMDWSGCGQPEKWTIADYRDCQAWQKEKHARADAEEVRASEPNFGGDE